MSRPPADPLAVVLVEGRSDRAAIAALARRRGRDLAAERIEIVAMGGATNIGAFVDRYGPEGLGLRMAGLYDAGEESYYRRALERAGLGHDLDREAMAGLGFHVCIDDLEDELIRALRPAGVVQILEREGDLGSFRIFQNQPAQRGRPLERQLRRFLGTRSGRKVHYGEVLVQAVDADRVPSPLSGVLAHV